MSFSRPAALALALVLAVPLLPHVAPSAQALASSSKVAMVGSDPSQNGGGLWHSDPAFAAFTFTNVAPSVITDQASLSAYDTVVLHVASTEMGCSTNTLTPAAKTALTAFVHAGGKMIIHDSECTFGGAVDYSWLPFPFTTSNPGAQGASGVAVIVEENSLSCSDPSQHCFIDVTALGSQTDAIGDSNVVVTQSINWCGDMKATNVQGTVGFNHMYAPDASGLYIYNGLDEDALATSPTSTAGGSYLAKLWLLELEQPWSPAGLPCLHPVVCDGHPIVITVTLDRPSLGFDYLNDVPSAQAPVMPVPRVLGPVTIVASSSDPTRTARINFSVDGTVRASAATSPYTFLWDPAGEPTEAGVHVLSVSGVSTVPDACPATATRQVLVPAFSQQARSIALFAGNALPESGDVEARGATTQAATGHDNRTITDQSVTIPTNVQVRVANDTADTSSSPNRESASATSVVARVDIPALGITLESLRSDATASLGRLDLAATSSGTAAVVHGFIGTQEIGGPVAPDTTLPIPGGHVILNEQIVDSTRGHIELTVNALHVYSDDGLVRDEIILGQSHAAVDLLRGSFSGAPRDLNAQNDASTGGDAADDFAHATPAPFVAQDANGNGVAALAGQLGGTDTVDYYSVVVVPGQKLQAVLVPADGAHASVARVHADPLDGEYGVSTDVTEMRMELLEPGTAAGRATPLVSGLGAPEHEELNVDVAGAWVLVVYHVGGAVANYTLTATVTPLQLLPDDQVHGPDAPSTCAAAIVPDHEIVAGVLRETDAGDVWIVHADLGDTLSAALKPTEDADGANFDLHVYDPTCRERTSSTFGTGLTPKGTPDAALQQPVDITGDWRVEVRRVSGIGNYYLDARATKPIATIPQDDALSGADAPASGCPGLALPAPGVYQGTMPDGDAADSYSFTVAAGDRIVMGILAQPGSSFGWTLYTPACAPIQNGATALGLGEMVFGPVAFPGTYTVTFTHGSGGGNYMFAIASK